MDVVRDATCVADLPRRRKAENGPSGTPADQVVDVGEAKMIEPARGSGAQISMLVEAIDNVCPAAIEVCDRRLRQRLQRQRDRAGKMLSFKDRGG
jgi:hypothetical protein